MIKGLLTVTIVLMLSTVASAQGVVKCRDAQGVVHYAASVDQLPKSCRAQVESPSNLPPVTATDRGISPEMRRRLDAEARQAERQREEQARQAAQAERQRQEQAERQRAEAKFGDDAEKCVEDTDVEINLKPGSRVTVLGTAKARFAFDKCMMQRGHAMGSR